MAKQKPTTDGIGVDRSGGPVVDPTANVIELVEAANKRQDDLRTETNRRIDTEIACVKEMLRLKADHAKEMAHAEASRLDSIRQVDAQNVSNTAAAANTAIQVLAATTASDRESIRTAMTATATTIAQQTANTFAVITERIAALEKSSYEGAGKSTATDPMIAELLNEVKSLRTTRSESTGKAAGLSLGWVILIGAVGLIGGCGTVAATGIAIYTFLRPALHP